MRPRSQTLCHVRDCWCPCADAFPPSSVCVWWQARDVVYLGGDSAGLSASAMAMPFTFGCQTYETGLFRSQLEDGIMGLAMLDPSIIFGLNVRARALSTTEDMRGFQLHSMMKDSVSPDTMAAGLQGSTPLTLPSWSLHVCAFRKPVRSRRTSSRCA